MNPRSIWVKELSPIAALLLLGWGGGAIFGLGAYFLVLLFLGYAVRTIYRLQRLANWLGNPRTTDIPNHSGLWGDVYSRIARAAVRRSSREKRLAMLLNEYAASTTALPDAAVALDANGGIRWFNDAASRLLGLQPAKDIGQPLLNLFRSPEMVAYIKAGDYSRTLQITSPVDSERELEVRRAPYGEARTLLLAQDITERLQHERVRRDFVANVSHELRTPLTVLSGFLENLQSAPDLQIEKLMRPLDLMAQQTARMSKIVEDLLLLTRLESGLAPSHWDEVEMAAILQSAARDAQALGPEVPAIQCQITSSRCVLGDETQLRSMVTNLVVNAVNHTPASGTITLIWCDRGTDCALEVRDTGVGVAAEHIPRLAERFYRVDAGRSRGRGGTGLGLAIVKHTLHRHDGRLEIQSRLGEGSRFICHFPSTRLTG